LYPFVVVPCPGTWRRTSVYSYRGLALLMPPLLRWLHISAGLSFKSGYQQTGYHHPILSYDDVKYYYCLKLGAWSLVKRWLGQSLLLTRPENLWRGLYVLLCHIGSRLKFGQGTRGVHDKRNSSNSPTFRRALDPRSIETVRESEGKQPGSSFHNTIAYQQYLRFRLRLVKPPMDQGSSLIKLVLIKSQIISDINKICCVQHNLFN